jgi:2-keto-4-pentenoate hydratase/2-oxohepta-3-ene-1,7-dioic acid hydratase in catechol pathway
MLESGDLSRWLDALAGPDARTFPLADVRLLAPLEPRQDLIALGLNYKTHVAEASGATQQAAPPKQPILFGKAATSVIGPDAEIRIDPNVTTQVDWEVELAVVIGRSGRDIPADRAVDHIFGYTVANDVSARDLQFLDGGQWYRGKSLDTFCPLGPWIVTADELGDARGLRLTLRVNGVTKQDASTDDLIFAIPEIIASASSGRTLYPGDVILTGTPGGVGFSRKPPEFLHAGDVVEAEIERIGVLRNAVRESQPRNISRAT